MLVLHSEILKGIKYDTIFLIGNKMGDSASESDSSSLDGGAMLPPSTVSRDQLQKRIESLQQQNRYVIKFP